MNSFHFRSIAIFLLTTFIFGKAEAQCTSQAGSMEAAQVKACGDETISVLYDPSSEMLDSDDVVQFVLHTNSGTTLGTILAISSTPAFDFITGSTFYGVTYYISSVVGNDDGTGHVDLTDPCLSVAAGTPIIWQELPTATVQGGGLYCLGTQVEVVIFFTGQGPWVFTYSIDGATQTTVAATSSPYTFPIFPNGQSIFCLTDVVDGTGCQGTVNGCATFAPIPQPFVCDATITDISCGGQNDGSIIISCTGGLPPYQYFWSNGSTSEVVTNLSIGTYTVTIVDATGCASQNSFTIVEDTPPFCVPNVSGSINCNNPEATIIVTCSGNGFPFTFQWAGPNNYQSTSPNPTIFEGGEYFVTVTGTNGCTFTSIFTVDGGTEDCGSIIGTVTSEEDGNCTLDPGESGLANWMVRASSTNIDQLEMYFDFTDADGHYSIQAPPGDYGVEVIPPADYWADCGGPAFLTLEDADDTDTADFHWLKTISCPLMEVDISTPLLRRCLDNNYYVSYCNNGSETANGATIEVTLDPLITLLNSNLPYTGPVNGVYTFDLGDVAAGECGNFYFSAHVSCDALLGETLCAAAHIYPDSLCVPIDPNWSGAFLEITSECTADSVIFTFTNTGTGDMDEPQGFIVVEDGVMLLTNDVQLAAGTSTTISFPANGATYNIVAQQVAGVTGYSYPSIFVEGCGTNSVGSISMGFASQFPEDDEGPFVSIDCQAVIGSFDPNDKRGYPLGYGNQHLIEAGQPLDYHIRFQNTGTDTAFKVVIQDIIDADLDISTLRPGTSSHPYQLDIHQDTLLFIFENILLPDSNVNEAASHGFVKFSIGQKAGLPIGTAIENEAGIFFDFNDPVLTNKTVHRLGDHFIETAVRKPVLPNKINCLVYPNPFADEAVVLLQGVENQEVELRLYDLTGRYLRSETIRNGVGKIKKDKLTTGLYFYELRLGGMAVGQGKLAIE